jgi:stage II sporulation protein D
MLIARRVLHAPSADHRSRWLVAVLLAALTLSAVVVPAFAADPSPDPSAGASSSPTVQPSGTPSESPSSSPAASPDASPSGAPSESPSATPFPTPTPDPTPTPTPSPTPSPTPAFPTTITTLSTSVRFYGRGYGHGVGLNQYGARGRALAGQTSAQILAAYFKGSTPATMSVSTNVRVLVLAGYNAVSTAPLLIHGRVTDWSIDRIAKVFPKDAVLKLWRSTGTADGVKVTYWRLRVYAADGTTLLYGGNVTGSLWIRGATTSTRLQLDTKPSKYDTYRGVLRVVLGASSATVINHVGMDTYLKGVVPVEMPASWPAEALRAQAVAARSYAARRLHPTTGSFDLYDDTRSQVYHGVKGESSVTNLLLHQAPGAILKYGASIVNAFFHSTGGGATENNEYAFVGSSGSVGTPVSYLRGIVDRSASGAAYDAAAPYYSWATSSLTRTQLSTMFKADSRTNVGDLLRLDLRKRGVSGRLYQVTLYGSTGTKTVSADVFRSVYNARRPSGTLLLRSNLFSTTAIP